MKELKTQFINALLVVLTVAVVISAAINFQQQKKYRLPDDGVTWVERKAPAAKSERVVALHVVEGSSAARAGIRQGDTLLRINGYPIARASEATEILFRLRAWAKPEYEIERRGVPIKTSVVITESEPDPAVYYQYIVGAAYLAIGLFVYFRRGKAPKSRHFYILCLISFVLCSFHYTGKLNNFDKVIYWGNVGAGLFAPTIFLHFCLTFPERRRWFRSSWRIFVVYLPALALFAIYVGVGTGILRAAVSLVELRWLLDRVWLVFLAATYLCGVAVLHQQHRRAEDSIVRHQLRWLRNGALLGILPFTMFYVLPYALGSVPGPYMKMAVLSLPLVPLTWAYAIVRYRLMDVDIIFQQGYVYTLATVAVLGIVYGLVFSLGNLEELSPTAVVFLIFIATFVFQPIRNWIQELLDRYYFYKDRYDYRSTLVEFARELSSETDLPRMLGSVADRLVHRTAIVDLRDGFDPASAAPPTPLRGGPGDEPAESVPRSGELGEATQHVFLHERFRRFGGFGRLWSRHPLGSPCRAKLTRIVRSHRVRRETSGAALIRGDVAQPELVGEGRYTSRFIASCRRPVATMAYTTNPMTNNPRRWG